MSRIFGSESWVGCRYVQVSVCAGVGRCRCRYVQVSPGSTPCIGCLAMSVSLCWWVGASRPLWDEGQTIVVNV